MNINNNRLTISFFIFLLAINIIYCRDDIRILGSKRGSSISSRSRSSSTSRGGSTNNSGQGANNSTISTGGSISNKDLIIIIVIPIAVVVFVIFLICLCRRIRLAKQKVVANNIQFTNQQDMNKQMQACNPIQQEPNNQQQQVFYYPNQYGVNQQQLQVNQNISYQQTNQEQSYLYFQQPAIQQASIL
ncbi:transmembrane protein, putative (macronuclear) [Tetrahymena thermophila SB210]|uniref:Transmembrane protein, putative n=1 Tax=Tetrahymena thermophila (strain SB210) TaxID=312017 RepID=Q23F67_TETTS|nr:transmembrane protein, putative [Tetrahymena thermophila SB210]EAR95286.1 transmembrane protein, putative [Tetrahymena thermophila SB210]|eukprot:XP_001015531.1 transmembrane protein, putative [Tetrahymena thermophila SB210]